jgi:hypothetical protein
MDSESSEDHSNFLTRVGSVLSTLGAEPPVFNKEKPAYSQVTELFNDIMQGVSQNPIILERVFNLLATHVAAPISAMINQLDRSVHGDVGAGGIAEFSAVNDMNEVRSKRFKSSHEIQLGQ